MCSTGALLVPERANKPPWPRGRTASPSSKASRCSPAAHGSPARSTAPYCPTSGSWGEGVDVPDADAVLFADPKRSSSDIIQALGRALRQPPGSGKTALLIIPIYVGHQQTTEEALKSSQFKTLWEVLNGLREHDSKLWRRLGSSPSPLDSEEKPSPPTPRTCR
ncbi:MULTISPECIES: helicase-related protein [unclassified Streptomyces]|uniref:helicase-related protein n=1 Tax=unclassified Streptomyces TaxID=2593676 RepID=UPI001927D932